MVDLDLVEKVWLEAGVDKAYLKEIQQICLSDSSPSSTGMLDSLPFLFCEVNQGCREYVIPVITAWTLLRHAARLLDDVEDGDLKERDISEPVALNVATGILFTVGAVLNSLETAGLQADVAYEIRYRFYNELLKVCTGQHLDLTESEPSLETCWQIAGSKSGSFLGLICWAGGRVANADPKQLNLYYKFGYNLGLLDQIRDDLGDLWADETHHSDLRDSGYQGLAVGYAYSVLPEDKRLELQQYLVSSGATPEAEKKARELIIQSGAGVYLIVQSTYYVQQNQELLAQMILPMQAREQLTRVLKKIQLPIMDL